MLQLFKRVFISLLEFMATNDTNTILYRGFYAREAHKISNFGVFDLILFIERISVPLRN